MNSSYGSLFKQQSLRSLQKYKTQHIEERVSQRSKQLLQPAKPTRVPSQPPPFTLSRNPHHPPPSGNEELARRVRQLQGQLRRKLTDDSVLRNIFRSKKHHQMSHIDLYLQTRQLEGLLEEARRQSDQERKEREEQERRHIKVLEEMGEKVGEKEQLWAEEKLQMRSRIEQLQEKEEILDCLLEELRRKNNQLLARIEQLAEEMEIEKEAGVLEKAREREQEGQRVGQLQARVEVLEAQCEELRESNSQLRGEEEACRIELEELQGRLQEAMRAKEEGEGVQARQEEVYRRMRVSQEEELQRQAAQLRSEIDELNREKMESRRKIEQLSGANAELRGSLQDLEGSLVHTKEQLEILSLKLQQERESVGRLARQAKQGSFILQEKIAQLTQCSEQLSDKAKLIEKLQERLHESMHEGEQLKGRVHSLAQQVEYVQSFSKLNDRIYNQNYKCLGRLIGINDLFRKELSSKAEETASCGEGNDLETVVGELCRLVEQLLGELTSLRGKGRECSSWLREIRQLLEQLRGVIPSPTVLSLMDSYGTVLRERQSGEDTVERAGVFHQLIEAIRQQSQKQDNLFIKEPIQDNYFSVPDSLEGTTLLPRIESTHKLRQSRHKSRHRLQAEQQVVRERLFEDEDKENRVWSKNRLHTQGEGRCSANSYSRQIRHRISKGPLQQRGESQRRSEVERKYFRS